MRGNPAARRGEGPNAASEAESSAGGMGEVASGPANTGRANRQRGEYTLVAAPLLASAGKSTSSNSPLIVDTLRASGAGRAPDHGHIAVVPIQDVRRSRVRAQNGIGIGEPDDPMYTGGTRLDHGIVAFHATQDPIHSERTTPCLSSSSYGVMVFNEEQITHPENRSRVDVGQPAPTISPSARLDVVGVMRPRRLTPLEWERLQGFPDGYTNIPGATDSSRYEALGSSMAVPCMRWIGKRIIAVERIIAGDIK
jgi:hypothetical protein